MTINKILVLGATGNTGHPLLSKLKQKNLTPIAAITHESKQSQLPKNTKAKICQFNHNTTINEALKDSDALFMLIPFDEHMLDWANQIIEAAQHHNLKHIVRLTAWQAAPEGPNKMAQLHGRIDQAVQQSGIPHTLLRCNSFMQNYTHMYLNLLNKRGGLWLAEEDAAAGWIDCEDIAEVAATVFAEPKPHHNKTYDLTGPEVLNNREVIQQLSDITGNPYQYQSIPQEMISEGYRKLGLSEWKIEVLESLTAAIRNGDMAQLTSDVETILGRKPRPIRNFFERNRGLFKTN